MKQGAATVAPSSGFESLLQPLLPLAYGVAHRLTRDDHDAQDLVQDAALLAWRGFHTFTVGTNFKAWFLRILTNCFYEHCRRRRRRPQTIDLDDAPPLQLFHHAAARGLLESEDPAAALLSEIDADVVARAITMLPEEFRVTNVLYFLDQLSYPEIAEILGCPIGTVRSRLHRGRRLLQKALWKIALEQGIVPKSKGSEKV